MIITTPKDATAFTVSNENINLAQEIPTSLINKNSSFSVNIATNITRNIANIHVADRNASFQQVIISFKR